jgi:hypothetical protein
MKRWGLVILILAFIPFICSCSEDEKKAAKPPVQEKKIQEGVSPAASPATTDWARQKEEFEKKARATLAELGKQTEAMKDKIAAAGADTKEKLAAQYKELTEKEGALSKKLDELKTATAETWEKIKTEIEAGIEYLQNVMKKETPKEKP